MTYCLAKLNMFVKFLVTTAVPTVAGVILELRVCRSDMENTYSPE
jgi:hypothetical protein